MKNRTMRRKTRGHEGEEDLEEDNNVQVEVE
jgi:hypothetical protein